MNRMEHDKGEADELRAPTLRADGRRRWIYPERRNGAHARRRRWLALLLMLVFAITPFLSRGGHPVLRLDIMQGLASIGGETFRVQEGLYLAFVALAAAFGLGFVSSVWGRVWCGNVCPQTVFVEWLIRPIEEWLEGPARRRQVQDAGEWTAELSARKALKQAIYIGLMLIITFLAFCYLFEPGMLLRMLGSPAEHPGLLASFLVAAGALYFDLVWFREQFCAFLCPYARFQSILMSERTQTVTYDLQRGEPRGRKTGAGDCIDCGLCVRVCPTGIDIRQGTQLECIQCLRCVDACNEVMTNIKRPKGLIRKDSLVAPSAAKTSFLRSYARPGLYGLLMVVCLAVLTVHWSLRKEMMYSIWRQPGTTYAVLDDGRISNTFVVRVLNQGKAPIKAEIQTIEGVDVICSICGHTLQPNEDRVGTLVIMTRTKAGGRLGSLPITMGGESRSLPFLAP